MGKMRIGLDVSTQGVKALAVDSSRHLVARASVPYPEPYRPSDDERVREADPQMWLRGVDAALANLCEQGVKVDGALIGGSAQQHGTVYRDRHGNLTRRYAPIWMDTSAWREAEELERHFGEEMLRRTGSRAQARFAAAQILRFVRTDPVAFAATARIDLVSSYVASHVTGSDTIDFSDAAGMNLMDLSTGDWDAEICDYISPDLRAKLPRIVRDLPFTGDNPATLVGCGATEPGTAVISLGTSDVFMAAMDGVCFDPQGYGHVFGNPLGGFMSLTCFKNGSLARDRVRRELGVDWRFFDETAFAKTSPGNGGFRAFPYFESEITPDHPATGIEANFDWKAASPEVCIRAVVEGQVTNMREHTRWAGVFRRIMLAGGAARSKGLQEVLARVFEAEVVPVDVSDAAALGAALLPR